VTPTIERDPEQIGEKVGVAHGVPGHRIERDLERFK